MFGCSIYLAESIVIVILSIHLKMEENKTLAKFVDAQESLVVQQSDFSLRTITDMVDNHSIDIAPHYQRRERWNLSKQSSLIESFILNVPVPPIYLSEDDYGTYSVIDGKQRITSIRSYLNDEYKLNDLSKFPELNGVFYSDLPQKIKNALSIRPYLRIVTLLKQSNPSLKYEVFLRLNTGGEKLKAQEIRNVAYSGPLNNLLYTLSNNLFLKEKLKIVDEKSSAYRNMDDLEHILRFFTLLENWKNIGGILSVEMDKYMEANRNISDKKLLSMNDTFNRSIASCQEIWGTFAFNKPVNSSWREQLISPLFDAQMVGVAMLTDAQVYALKGKNKEVLEATKNMFMNDADFNDAVSQATNNPKNIKMRISKMYEMLNQVAN